MNAISGLIMLEIPANIIGRSDKIYPTLIWDQDTAILVDTGFPGQSQQILQAIEAAGVSLEKLNRVIITHHDIDHIGGLSGILLSAPSHIEVLAHDVEKPYIEGQKQPLKLAKLEANLSSLPEDRRSVYERLKSGFESSRVPVDRTLKDGEMLPYCGGITVIYTPGHTLGHICLYLEQYKTLIAGDALRVTDGVLTATPDHINHDMALYNQSLKKLAAYDVETVICYHGGRYQDHIQKRIMTLFDEQSR